MQYLPRTIGVQYVVHLGAGDADHQRVQRIVLAAPRSKSVREPEKLLLVDRVQHRYRRPLDDFVLKRGYLKGADGRPASGYADVVTVAPDTLPDGPERAGPRSDDRGLSRSPAISAHQPRALHLASGRRMLSEALGY